MANHKWERCELVKDTRALTEQVARHWRAQRCARCGLTRRALRGAKVPKWFYRPDALPVWKHLEHVPGGCRSAGTAPLDPTSRSGFRQIA